MSEKLQIRLRYCYRCAKAHLEETNYCSKDGTPLSDTLVEQDGEIFVKIPLDLQHRPEGRPEQMGIIAEGLHVLCKRNVSSVKSSSGKIGYYCSCGVRILS